MVSLQLVLSGLQQLPWRHCLSDMTAVLHILASLLCHRVLEQNHSTVSGFKASLTVDYSVTKNIVLHV